MKCKCVEGCPLICKLVSIFINRLTFSFTYLYSIDARATLSDSPQVPAIPASKDAYDPQCDLHVFLRAPLDSAISIGPFPLQRRQSRSEEFLLKESSNYYEFIID